MKLTFKVFRYDPAKDDQPRMQEYGVEAQPTDRVLDCLNRIRWEQDPSLAFRSSCAHGVCGSDAMRINGTCALACQKLVKDYEGDTFTIEPLPQFEVVRDLVVRMDGFFEKYRRAKPYLLPKGDPPEHERLQSPEDRKAFDEAIRCILCACCTASCPVTGENPSFIGPAAVLRGFRFLFDSRDGADAERLQDQDSADFAQGCKVHWACTKVCPKEIPVTKSIGAVKRRIFEAKKARKS